MYQISPLADLPPKREETHPRRELDEAYFISHSKRKDLVTKNGIPKIIFVSLS